MERREAEGRNRITVEEESMTVHLYSKVPLLIIVDCGC